MEPNENRGARAPQRGLSAAMRPLWRGGLLILIALGGAGLAVAVDRPQNSVQRPELSWQADQQAAPYIARLSAALDPLDKDIDALSEHAQGVLGSITSLDLDKVETGLRAGDEATARVETAAAELATDRDAALDALEEWRLGDNQRAALDSLGTVADQMQQVPGYWHSLADQARLVVGLMRDLRDHDDLVFQATSAGRESRWPEALRLLGEAGTRLDDAGNKRDEIAGHGEVATLDDLLARYTTYDGALTDLYTYVHDTGNLSGADFDEREQRVEQAQQTLPKENSVMTVIAAEAAAKSITESLVGIEQARGAILDAEEAILGSPAPTTETEPTPEPVPTLEPGATPPPTTGPGHTPEPTLPPA